MRYILIGWMRDKVEVKRDMEDEGEKAWEMAEWYEEKKRVEGRGDEAYEELREGVKEGAGNEWYDR